MSSFSSYGNLRDPWFKLGPIEVGSTMFVVLWVVVSWLAFVAAPTLPGLLGFSPALVAQGEVWRVFSWPLANSLGLWPVLNLFFFYIFGTELEQQIGRSRMAKLLLGIWAALTVASALVAISFHTSSALVGIGQVQFVLFLLWIAENPRRPFFFNIPAWVVGAVLVALQVLQLIAARAVFGLFELLIGFAMVAVLARRLGLLGDQAWIPGRAKPRSTAPKVNRGQAREARRRTDDDARLNALLDQISARGMDSLSPAQRRELMKLRNRR